MAADDQHATDELMLRDLPGTLAGLVLAAATLALLWELAGILLVGFPSIRPLASLDIGDIGGIALFTTGWFGLVVGLLVLRHRRDDFAD